MKIDIHDRHCELCGERTHCEFLEIEQRRVGWLCEACYEYSLEELETRSCWMCGKDLGELHQWNDPVVCSECDPGCHLDEEDVEDYLEEDDLDEAWAAAARLADPVEEEEEDADLPF